MRARLTQRESFLLLIVKNGLTRHGLARKAGISETAAIHLLQGSPVYPSTAKKVCEVLGLDFSSWFEIVERRHKK